MPLRWSCARSETQSSEQWSAEYSAAGATAQNRLDMIVQCAAHMQHHIGQMIYLGYQWEQMGQI